MSNPLGDAQDSIQNLGSEVKGMSNELQDDTDAIPNPDPSKGRVETGGKGASSKSEGGSNAKDEAKAKGEQAKSKAGQ